MLLLKFACRANGFRAQRNTKRRAAEAGRRMGIFGRWAMCAGFAVGGGDQRRGFSAMDTERRPADEMSAVPLLERRLWH